MKSANLKRGLGPLVIVIIIAIILAIGGGVYYNSKKASPVVDQNTEVESEMLSNANVQTETSNMSLRDLLAQGKNLMCTFSSATTSGSASGIVYINNGMMRGDFTMTAKSSGSIDSHMIKDGDLVYAWSGSQGAKMFIESFSATSSTQAKSDVNLDQKADFKCQSWGVDGSKFVVPTDVKFVDISAMMNAQMKAGAKAGVSTQCSACASLPAGTAKTQCMAAMHC